MRHAFTYRTYLWLVDLDHLPRLGRGLRLLAGFRGRDHLGDPQLQIRDNLDRFLVAQGVDLAGGRVMMLAQARVLGYVFNPLTVYWCHQADGPLACVVAEVHNTYRQRHAYLLRTDDHGRARAPKQFYVSPFYPVDGGYRMCLPEPGPPGPHDSPALALSVTLTRSGRPSFVASVHGAGRRPPRGPCSAPPYGTPGPPPPSRPGSAGRGSGSACVGCPSHPGRRTNPRRPSSDQQHAARPALRRRRRTVARRRRGGRLPGACGRGPGPVHQGRGGPPAAGAVPGRAPARRGAAGRPGHGPAPARGVLPPPRCLRADRVRRIVPGRRLGLRRPDRLAHRVRRSRRRPHPALAAADAHAGGTPVRRPATGRPVPVPAATSAVTTTCPTSCSRCSSTRP